MADQRPFPPSGRRRAAAHRAGLHAASPHLVGAAAASALLIAALATGPWAGGRLEAALAPAWERAPVASGPAPAIPASPMPGPAGSAPPPLAAALPPGLRAPQPQLPAAAPRPSPRAGAPQPPPPAAQPQPTAAAASPTAVAGRAAQGAAPAAPAAAADPAAPRLGEPSAPRGDEGSLRRVPGAAGRALALVLALAAPLIGCAAAAAALAHLVQTRAGWLPRRRRVAGAPSVPCGPAERVRRAAAETAAAAAMGGITVALVWWLAPRWAALPSAASLAGASAALIGASAAALAIAWACVGALDGLARHAALGAALRMTAREHRDDERQAGLDPRWRAARGRATELSPRQMMAVAAVLVVADGAAVAIAWDPARRPIPTRLVVGRGAQRAQLVGLARQLRIPIHSEPALATALADRDGPVPAAQWPRLAEVIAAVRARGA